jgi:hypothetical protein
MADGRVVAYGAGDTASGPFTCVVRRAGFRNRVRYSIDFKNGSGAPADVELLRGGAELHKMLVPARSSVSAAFTLPVDALAAFLIVDVRCDGATIRILERRADEHSSRTRRLLIIGAIAAAASAAGVAVLAFAAWHVVRRFKPRSAPDERVAENVPEPSPPDVSRALVEIPREERTVGPDEHDATTVELFEPEAVRHHENYASPGATYDARPLRGYGAARGIATIAVAVVVVVAGFVIAHPHIADLGAPNQVLQGSAIDVPYASSGLGALRYRVSSSTGLVIAGGDLAAGSGTLHIAIPASQRDETYRVQLTLAGPLGDARNEATINARALPQAQVITRVPRVPNVRSFAVTRSTGANDVPSIVVFYDVLADRGTVRLVDSRGIQYGVTPLNAGGEAHFALPNGVDSGTLAVELRAVRGGMVANSRMALPSGQDGIAISAKPSESSDAAEAVPVVVPASLAGSAPIRVRIVHHYQDLHLVLIGANARKITGSRVPAGARIVTLAHPAVAVATRVTVQATYRVNNESDTVIRPVILLPAAGG